MQHVPWQLCREVVETTHSVALSATGLLQVWLLLLMMIMMMVLRTLLLLMSYRIDTPKRVESIRLCKPDRFQNYLSPIICSKNYLL